MPRSPTARSLPHVAITTTYSGAELTPFFGMTDPATRQKNGAGGPTIAPMAAFYDPSLTLTTPARVSAETGMNALAHCVEVAWSPSRTPEAEAIALAGAARIVDALPRVVDDPDDLGARTDMLQGSILAGRCLQNASMGVHHGLAQLVGGRTGIPHGLLERHRAAGRHGASTPHAVPGALDRLAQAIGVDDATAAVAALVERLGLPSRLSDVGVTDEDLEAVARLSQGNGNVRANPRPVSEDDALGHPRVGLLVVSFLAPAADERSELQHQAELVALRVGDHADVHAVLLVVLDHLAAELLDPGRCLVQVGYLEVDVHPVLPLLRLRHLLEGQRRPALRRSREHDVLVPPGRHLDAECRAPELAQPVGVGAVDDQVRETSDGSHPARLLREGRLTEAERDLTSRDGDWLRNSLNPASYVLMKG